jgi:iron complex outermembrane receptor protein
VRYDEIYSNAIGALLYTPLAGAWGNYTHHDARGNAGAFASIQTSMLKTHIQGDLRANFNNVYGLDWLPHLGLDHTFALAKGQNLKAFASVNRSFRLPTFTDLYYSLGGAQGSTSLRPEYAWNTELGFALTMSGKPLIQRIGATAYERRGTNLIDWIYRSVDGNQVLHADNVTAVTIRGLEFELGGQLAGTWSARAQFAGHAASDVNGQSIYALDYLARRIQFTWNSALKTSGTPSPLQFGLAAVGQDRAGSYVQPDGSTTPYNPFATLDLRASYRLGDLLLYADGMNLTGTQAMDRGNIPLPGRWLKLGLRLEWQ